MVRRYIVQMVLTPPQDEYSKTAIISASYTISIMDSLKQETVKLPQILIGDMSATDVIDGMNQYCRELNNQNDEYNAYLNEIKIYTE